MTRKRALYLFVALVLMTAVVHPRSSVHDHAIVHSAAEGPSPPPTLSSATAFSVAQVQTGLRLTPLAWLGRTVRVRANYIALCSVPDSHGSSSCRPGRYSGEPSFGVVDDDTGDQDRALQRSLPLLLDDFLTAHRPHASLLHNLAALAHAVPGLGRFVPAPTDLTPPEASGLTYLDLEETPVFIVRLIVQSPCTIERLTSLCYAGELVGLSQ